MQILIVSIIICCVLSCTKKESPTLPTTETHQTENNEQPMDVPNDIPKADPSPEIDSNGQIKLPMNLQPGS